MKPILSPCHSAPIWISVDGRGDVTVYCSVKGCVETWDKNGAPE
ncbi:hypothetical protein SEA_PRAIRIE_49 [Arthrobacter phage Prairie]|uniref:Uncharacterized protein n=1 Tax=Arthrobacter phage Prairie TaxID=2816463 RepID=A0A8A5LQ94_9CAUD|nr:hypothetical protein SEA_PRAIRIE_49 [Arthrobacter phage Prairie]